ncbi:stage V sporulation protein AE [Weizmannia acidilactici]|uniref:Stage V sporulation protein AE n=1 Tax=Weizmannia acidilactici TaxID=2607726 RepID=A0A5J4JC03_9BACI|nr:stage V sporulation protein AE [Weizmannia acidilactici]GER66074.1 stage V sporulation protein AE [Weizmannia acidilactici]GER69291.1 stage V sporulation protein AE [Weizmannia acidilactici]GER72383.1 stage V sporulation protein AE [Weizmannia acidilactici]
MGKKRRVILVTDGDEYAKKAIECVAKKIGGRCISQTRGNPTVLSGEQTVELIKNAASDPVFAMFDDSGYIGPGSGEEALMYVAGHPDIEVLGVIAVASKTHQAEWSRVDVCIDNNGELTPYGVDKFGVPEMELKKINGDTVYSLDCLDVPVIVGIGDIGKMSKKDDYKIGAPITEKAVSLILERSGFRHDEHKRKKAGSGKSC